MPSTTYFDPSVSLEARLVAAFDELEVAGEVRGAAAALLAPLRNNGPITREHYEHSIRVALVARAIAPHAGLIERAMFYAGLLHDVGKARTRLELLGRHGSWSEDDAKEMEEHVVESWRMLQGSFNFTSKVALRHHRSQKRRYPENLPQDDEADLYARHLALADSYDAMHRVDTSTGGRALTGEQIKERMLEANPDLRDLVERLYQVGVFTTTIYDP
ncbi:MAG: HD domain-containing protein [Patescibacteria group bacterium]